MKLANLTPRVITAAILIAGLIGLEFAQSRIPGIQQAFVLIGLILVVLAAGEFINVCKTSVENPFAKVLYHSFLSLPGAFAALIYFSRGNAPGWNVLSSVMLLTLVVPILLMSYIGRRGMREVLDLLPEMYLGSLVVGAGGVSLISMAFTSDHHLLFWTIIIVSITDTAAYFVGSLLGKNKLSESISPGKTIEGLLGGVVFAVLIGFLIQGFFVELPFRNPLWCIPMIAIFAQCFDLSKSAVKRKYSVKDTGAILPGHGGILDRIDGILGASFAVHLLNGFYHV